MWQSLVMRNQPGNKSLSLETGLDDNPQGPLISQLPTAARPTRNQALKHVACEGHFNQIIAEIPRNKLFP